MNPPTSMTRFLARPRVATALYVGCAVAVLGWFGGGVPWWLGLMALCFVGTVRKAVGDVRRYNQWAAEWRRMGPESAPAPPVTPRARPRGRKASSRWHGVIAAALLLFPIIPSFAMSATSEALRNAMTLLWLATAVYLLCKIVLNLRPRRSSVKAVPASPVPAQTNAADVVQWVLPRASSSPSRAEATRQLPEHCLRLMS